MTRYEKHTHEPGDWTDWFQPVPTGYKMSCCDCGLVHGVDFRILNGRVQLRVQRLNRSTAMKRRWMRRKTEGKG